MKQLFFVLSLFFIFSFAESKAQSGFDRIEPAFWWVGMQNPELQLLVHADKLSDTRVKINYAGVKIESVHLVENDNYLFINLLIDKKAKAGKFNIDFMDGKKRVYRYEYELKARKKNSALREGFSNADVIYLLMPDRFSNGDPKNDNQKNMLEKADRNNPNGRHGGDIQGVINKLPYLSDLGITALWLNPVQENNMPAYSYHGYAITDFYKVDSRFGGNQAYLKLSEESEKKGIKLIMDMVFNHCGLNHWWMKDLPMKSWVHQWDKFTRSNYRGTVVGDPHASKHDQEIMLKGWFDTSMPDLNQNNPYVAKYLIQNSIWWIEYGNLAGIRMDTYPYAYKEMMQTWVQAVLREYPNFSIVGETWLDDPSVASYWANQAGNLDGFSSGLSAITDFPLCFAMHKAFNDDNGWWTGISALYYVLAKDFLYKNPENNVTFIDNHDLNRLYEVMGHDIKKVKMALAFLLTTRGTPMLYYGTEILMDGWEHEGHGSIRKDFPGGWQADKVDAFSKKGRSAEQNELFNYLKKLLNWRKNTPALHTGKLTHFVPNDGVYTYFRSSEKQTVMVLLNHTDKVKDIDTQQFREILSQFSSAVNVITGEKISELSKLKIAAMSALILELKK